jgi:hypothetical protein
MRLLAGVLLQGNLEAAVRHSCAFCMAVMSVFNASFQDALMRLLAGVLLQGNLEAAVRQSCAFCIAIMSDSTIVLMPLSRMHSCACLRACYGWAILSLCTTSRTATKRRLW